MKNISKLSTESYKGVRDFYPEDLFVQKLIFSTWRKVAEQFGYIEYNASVLEPAELYKAKTGDEIVNEQTYTFTDRGEREVTLRPEMTPTVARMVAGKQHDLTFPLRWYSIPNLFRYEKPQKGRLREHWQLNVDIFGAESVEADIEIITIAHQIMKNFGAKDTDFVIKINNRKIINALYHKFDLNEETSYKVSKIIDKKNKISASGFEEALTELMGEKAQEFIVLLNSNEKLIEFFESDNKLTIELGNLLDELAGFGIGNAVFDPTLMRGFDYYTGMVFEVFDLHPDNNRSVFGGGRYDDLLDIFGARKIPAVGFGAGDVTMQDFLVTHDLMPKYKTQIQLQICITDKKYLKEASVLANTLREKDLNVALDLSGKKLGDQLKIANKQNIPFVICVGEDEIKSKLYGVKNMETGKEKKVGVDEIASNLK
jgi:histidyl-tRNA synthetase